MCNVTKICFRKTFPVGWSAGRLGGWETLKIRLISVKLELELAWAWQNFRVFLMQASLMHSVNSYWNCFIQYSGSSVSSDPCLNIAERLESSTQLFINGASWTILCPELFYSNMDIRTLRGRSNIMRSFFGPSWPPPRDPMWSFSDPPPPPQKIA